MGLGDPPGISLGSVSWLQIPVPPQVSLPRGMFVMRQPASTGMRDLR